MKIINDIDVSKCKDKYGGKYCGNTGASCTDIECEQNPDCFYRQLQRKTQECEKYKNCLKKVKARVIQENADKLLEWIVETIESVGV